MFAEMASEKEQNTGNFNTRLKSTVVVGNYDMSQKVLSTFYSITSAIVLVSWSWSRGAWRPLTDGLRLEGCGFGPKVCGLVMVSKSRLESTPVHYISRVLSCLTDYWKHVSNSR